MINLIKLITSDLNSGTSQPFIRVFLKFFFNMSFRLMLNFRIGNYLHQHRGVISNILIMWLKKRQIKNYASDISYQCSIGRGVKFPHPTGIVIGVGSVIGHNVIIWQQVTLGSSGHKKMEYPRIGNNAKLFANCQILGGVEVGQGAKVGASALVISNVPDSATAVGIPAKIL